MRNANRNASGIALSMLQAIHATYATYATNERGQDTHRNVTFLNVREGLWISRFSRRLEVKK